MHDKDKGPVCNGLGDGVNEAEAARGNAFQEKIVQPRLVERGFAFVQLLRVLRTGGNAGHVEPEIGQAGRADRALVPASENCQSAIFRDHTRANPYSAASG